MRICSVATAAAACFAPALALADPVADFYRDKTVTMYVPVSGGGDYDQRARLVARHIARHLPGQPTTVTKNMPGGSGLTLPNWVQNVASRDGTVLQIVLQNMPFHQATGGNGVRFDVREWAWVGNTTKSPNVIAVWHTTGIKSIEDTTKREVVLGAPGANTRSVFNALALNVIIGSKFKFIVAYPGGNDVNLAMERGEVDGRHNSWASWVSTHPEWIKERKIVPLVQIGLDRHPDLKDVPLLTDLARSDEDRAVMRLLAADTAISRPISTTPGVPAERVEALRRAFDATVADRAFVAEAERAAADLSPSTGEEVQAVVEQIVATPKPILDRVSEIFSMKVDGAEGKR
jgi:tripartite-type tricarboxylate transporter receptor subunit TctC